MTIRITHHFIMGVTVVFAATIALAVTTILPDKADHWFMLEFNEPQDTTGMKWFGIFLGVSGYILGGIGIWVGIEKVDSRK